MNSCVHVYLHYQGFFADWNRLLNDAYRSICRDVPLQLNYSQPYYPYKDHPDANITTEYFEIDNTVKPEAKARIMDMYKKVMDPSCLISPEFVAKCGVTDYGYNMNMFVLQRDHDIKMRRQNYTELPPSDDYHIKKKFLTFKKMIWDYKFKLNPTIVREIDSYYNNFMKGHVNIGIHFRYNCAKASEQFGRNFRKSLDAFNVIDNFVHSRHIDDFRIYLATDTKNILEEFRHKYGDRLLYNTQNVWVSDNIGSIEPHMRWLPDMKEKSGAEYPPPGIAGGRELLKDVLVLTRCDYFIKSPSNLSTWVFILNPDIEEI